MLNAIKTFTSEESGAVTVDWVVLTAALVGLGLAVMSVVAGGIDDMAQDIRTDLDNDHTAYTVDAATGSITYAPVAD